MAIAKKIFFGNYKGGVGKTTSTYQIARKLASKKKKILLVDLDPQSSLSGICLRRYGMQYKKLFDVDAEELKTDGTLNYIYVLYMQARKMNNIKFTLNCEKIIKHINLAEDNYLDFIPNSLFSDYGGLDKISMDVGRSVENLLILRDFFEDNSLNSIYDYIFFDCPPSNNIITQSAFLYCDYYIIPTIMDQLSVSGVGHYKKVIEGIYHTYCKEGEFADVLSLLFGSKPVLIGVFETLRKYPTKTDGFRNEIKRANMHLFDTFIEHKKEYADRTGEGYEADLQEYDFLADEIERQIDQVASKQRSE